MAACIRERARASELARQAVARACVRASKLACQPGAAAILELALPLVPACVRVHRVAVHLALHPVPLWR